MNLKCIVAFGNFVPGDELEVPDGALFDHFYFKEVVSTANAEARMENDGAPATPVKTPKGGVK